MVKIPTTKAPGRFKSGDEVPGLICQNESCGAGIALGGDLTTLPGSFELTCPRCGQKGTYQKDAIQTLTAHRKQ